MCVSCLLHSVSCQTGWTCWTNWTMCWSAAVRPTPPVSGCWHVTCPAVKPTSTCYSQCCSSPHCLSSRASHDISIALWIIWPRFSHPVIWLLCLRFSMCFICSGMLWRHLPLTPCFVWIVRFFSVWWVYGEAFLIFLVTHVCRFCWVVKFTITTVLWRSCTVSK